MKPGPFISHLAAAARVEEKTLSVLARALRDADILEKGPRGINAIEVDHVYLAKTLIGRMGTDKPARAVAAFGRFSAMQMLSSGGHQFVKSQLPDPDHSLLDFMVEICKPTVDLTKGGEFEVRFVGSAAVDVVRDGEIFLMYGDSKGLEKRTAEMREAVQDKSGEKLRALMLSSFSDENSLHGIVETRSFTSTWLQELKTVVLADRGGG